MAKNLQISFLLDFYGEMLTEKQREMIEYYYNEDLSLAEIADNQGYYPPRCAGFHQAGGGPAFGDGREAGLGPAVPGNAGRPFPDLRRRPAYSGIQRPVHLRPGSGAGSPEYYRYGAEAL